MLSLTTRAGLTLATLVSLGLAVPAAHAQFIASGIVVSRDGTGSAALSSAATAVFLDEYTLAPTQTAPEFTVALPTAASGSNYQFTDSGSATSDGALTLSGNGQYLMLGGYDFAVGTAGVVASTANRVVARVDASGSVDTSTALTSTYSGNNIRSVASTNGGTLITAGSGTATDGGVRSAPFGVTGNSTQLESAAANTRVVNLFGGNTYFSSSSGSYKGIYEVGASASATPTTIASDATSGGAYDFYFADPNTLYVADNTTTSGILKYTKTAAATSFTGAGTLIGSAEPGLTGLTGTTVNGVTTLYAVDPKNLFSIVDNGAGALSTYTTLATAATNEAFRGVDFAPIAAGTTIPASPEPSQWGLIAFMSVGLSGLILKARKRTAAQVA